MFVNSFGKLGLIAAFAMSTPALGQVPGSPADIGDALEASVEEAVEEAVSRSVESAAEKSSESAIEAAIEQTVEESVQNSVENAVESGVAGAVESALEDSVTGDVEETISSVIEEGIGDEVLNGTLDGAAAETANAVSSVLPVSAQGGAQSGGRTVEFVVKDGRRVIRHEWVLVVDVEEADQVEALGASIVMRAPLEATGDVLFIVNVSDDDERAGEIQETLSALSDGRFDRNSLFDATSKPARASVSVVNGGAGSQHRSSGATIGLIDTAVDRAHPALAAARIVEKDFVSIGGARPVDHGTAVASLVVAPQVHTASVFFQTADGATGATTASLVRAIDWLRSTGVDVVNISLAGARNSVLEKMIRSAQEDGMVFVAAIGNEGPAAKPLYPAAYEDVVGVTAVDDKGEVYRWALQGPQVDVAARGVNVNVAKAGGGYVAQSGTSFAAPVVASFLAQHIDPRAGSRAAMEIISKYAAPGATRDDVIGYGLLPLNVTN